MGHYPAIDIEASISRVMNEITDQEHQYYALRFKKMYSVFQQNKDLISVGAYTPGSDEQIDEAIKMQAIQVNFLQQSFNHGVAYQNSLRDLANVMQQQVAEQAFIPAVRTD